ncbi:MAG: MFS transporter [Candidatus Obscuribacter sp.]|nr:MFS transporter [Candidatus Obscuribacter sp.]MDQ5967887.1 transporter [Cyanobacteriota bacterium erpe_2018_sw_39hr_WHONDRS-SW48-000098_B_bin.30]MBK9204915.1 MFS transporter [Candidatus Obscuribacter sp.]MBK9620600.1 MFS transporter [Candidatus Obscuribacter sp.]MBK9772627.1 MFS transporter [Candidatus Obscuribacter sp.]
MQLAVHKQSWTVLGIVAYALFMDYFLYGLIVPLGPYSPAKVTSEHEIGMLYGAYAIGVLVATPVFGYLGDRLGCRRPMLIGVALSVLAVVLFCFGSHFYWALLARFAQGAAAAASWTAGLALVAEHYVEKRVQMMGLAMVGSTAGSVLGPVAGGWLFDMGGYNLPFIVTGAMVAIDACLRIFFLPPEKGSTEKAPDLKALLLDKSILVAGLAVAVAAAGWGIIEPLLPNQLKAGGVSPGQVGLIFTVSSIVYGCFAPVVSWVSERVSVKKTICFGIVGMALTLPLLALTKGIVMVGACLCLVNVAYAFLLNPTSAELGNAVDRRGMNCYAAVYAVYNITYSLGMMSADTFASELSEHMSFLQVLLCMSGTLLLSIPLILKGVPDQAPEPAVEPELVVE